MKKQNTPHALKALDSDGEEVTLFFDSDEPTWRWWFRLLPKPKIRNGCVTTGRFERLIENKLAQKLKLKDRTCLIVRSGHVYFKPLPFMRGFTLTAYGTRVIQNKDLGETRSIFYLGNYFTLDEAVEALRCTILATRG